METIGRFEVRRKLGIGGFGTVWEAWDPRLKRRVAIKTCSASDPDVRQRFLLEAEIAASLDHPNIVHIYDFGLEGDVPYLVEEFCEGEDLSTLLERIPHILTLEQKLKILAQVARGLEHAHGRGVVHRDVKPGNIRVLPDWRAKLLDFGMARLTDSAVRLTRAGTTIGTAAYMSPEQVEGLPVGPAADLFSLGVTAYELVSGVRPFDADSLSRVFYRILHEHPAPLLEFDPRLPQRLSVLVQRCLAKRAEDRPSSASEVATILEAILDLRTDPAYRPPLVTGSVPARTSDREMTPEPMPVAPPVAQAPAPAKPKAAAPAALRQSPGKNRVPRWVVPSALGAMALGVLLGGVLFWMSREGPVAQTVGEQDGAGPIAVSERSSSPEQAAAGASLEDSSQRQSPEDPPAPPANPAPQVRTEGLTSKSEAASAPASVGPAGTPVPPPSPPALPQVRASTPSPAAELLERAEQRFDRGDWQEASRLLAEFLNRYPDDRNAPYANRLLARAEDRLGGNKPKLEDRDLPRAVPATSAPEDSPTPSGEERPQLGSNLGGVTPPRILEHPSGVRFRQLPAGEAWVGCVAGDPDCQPQELPGRLVRVERAFYLAETETTVGQYRKYLEATGAVPPAAPGFPQDDRHPIVNVSWFDARNFCAWVGGRLPTEVEWEYAARGGSRRARFPWTEGEVSDRANAAGTAGGDTFRFTVGAGSFPPNGYGFYDLAGNVWEWVEDALTGGAAGTKSGSTGGLRVVKGGSWFNDVRALRVSAREGFASSGTSANLGFRCARDGGER